MFNLKADVMSCGHYDNMSICIVYFVSDCCLFLDLIDSRHASLLLFIVFLILVNKELIACRCLLSFELFCK